ncbi:MAG: NAD(P)/FAD-dependent oxidoreductase [Bryobacterales bacterium]|nr:NAD(P)/FAD-dependent oxidoreductase [Bryobacterales bacterium]MBV9398659.1 NAD(P)/FAD-dependent oxidoreductase [Bryobacterales bacterium]
MNKKVYILGGGFGGLYSALELERQLGKKSNVDITLVNRDNFFLFTPMLHEVAASDLDLTTIVNPTRKLLRKVQLFSGEVEHIDLRNSRLTLSHGFRRHSHTVPYDHLILALGSTANFYNLPGLMERAITMKSLGDAVALRNRLIAHLEEADTDCAKDDREPLLTFVVAGGGFAGVETIAAVNDFLRHALPLYRNLHQKMVRLVLVHSGMYLLPELGEELGRYTLAKLEKRGVEIILNTKVSAVSDDSVTLANGATIRSATIIWTAGTTPNPLLEVLPCAKDRGRVAVNDYLQIPDFPNVWAVGDCAAVIDRNTGRPCPPTAQHALRQGRVAAHNIVAAIQGRSSKTFSFRMLGQMAAIGQRVGVAEVLGVKFSGFLAWWLWRTIYLAKLPGWDRKVRVALQWTLDVVFSKDVTQYMTVRAPAMSREDEENALPAAISPRQ